MFYCIAWYYIWSMRLITTLKETTARTTRGIQGRNALRNHTSHIKNYIPETFFNTNLIIFSHKESNFAAGNTHNNTKVK